jgi:hypothetical protein
MIVIVANRWNQTAGALAARWAAHEVGVLTAQDLSVPGWRQYLSGTGGCTAIVAGNRVPQNEITGVLTLAPCVVEQELVDIRLEDRPYVASEMTAFLLYWLSCLSRQCPVLNRPTAVCLSGPYWRQEKWAHVAAQAGIPVQPVRRLAALPGSTSDEETIPAPAVVTVIGKHVFGDTDPALQQHARYLADLAGVGLLAARFSSPERDARFVSADISIDLADDSFADAALEYLHSGLAKCA